MSNMEIKVVEPSCPDLLHLIGKLDEDLLRRYPAEAIHGLDFNDPNIMDIVFVVAYRNSLPVGCGAIRPIDTESTELKRFFVESSYRRMGIASRMLSFLEHMARQMNFHKIRLETGTEQPEAILFYKNHGYKKIDKFGEYVHCEMSLCYEKSLT